VEDGGGGGVKGKFVSKERVRETENGVEGGRVDERA